MASLNQAILVGNLGAKPELKNADFGNPVTNLRVATNTVWKDKESGERKERTEWHPVVVWGRSAENCCEYLDKGSKVLVEGEIRTRTWDDESGTTRYTTEIVAGKVLFLDRPDQAQ